MQAMNADQVEKFRRDAFSDLGEALTATRRAAETVAALRNVDEVFGLIVEAREKLTAARAAITALPEPTRPSKQDREDSRP